MSLTMFMDDGRPAKTVSREGKHAQGPFPEPTPKEPKNKAEEAYLHYVEQKRAAGSAWCNIQLYRDWLPARFDDLLEALQAAERCLTELHPFGVFDEAHAEEYRAISLVRTKVRAATSKAGGAE
jgi:hypothetical protein